MISAALTSHKRLQSLFLPLLLLLSAMFPAPAFAQAPNAAVQTTWRLLDYIAVDYPGAVQNGEIVSQLEYDEMTEFSASVSERLAALPAHPQRAQLISGAGALQQLIARRAAPVEVDRAARDLADRLLQAYPVPLAPQSAPDVARGGALYAENCASCHGAAGAGNGPMAQGMDPPPIDFIDRSRARERSLFALYQVIDQGLEGTAMQSFAHLPEADRWALAFRSGQFAYPPELAAEGERLWRSDATVRARVPDLQTLVSLTPAALAAQIGDDRATALMAYLRANPDVLEQAQGSDSLTRARDLLRQSLAVYRQGNRDGAEELALAAYLDGFEPVEALLGARDSGLVARVERAMGELRAAIGRGAPEADVAARVEQLDSLFGEAETALAPEAGSGTSTFLGAFAILLREGLEALLIVIAMITFLIKADRRDLLRYVHGGWIAALVAGVGTWWVASHLITISGANREVAEGFGALLAAVVLLFVGIWMHGKSQADAWQRYVRETLDRAMTRGSAWFLFGLSFIAVYREVFETIIFYAALGAQGEGLAMAGGIAVAALLLAVIAWAMLRYSRRLPIAKFFQYSAILIAILAVVLAGKGFAALQEAGMIGVTPLAGFPRSELLGLYPTLETLGAQVVTVLLLAVGFLRSRRQAVLAAA
jgi:high-affinity iron transporter